MKIITEAEFIKNMDPAKIILGIMRAILLI